MPTRKSGQSEPEGAGVDLGAVVEAFTRDAEPAKRSTSRAKGSTSKRSTSKADPLADRILAAREPAPERSTPVYGRAKQGHPQLNVRVPADIKRRLQRYCFEHEVEMSEVIERLIDEHVPD